MLACGGISQTINLWDLDSGLCVQKLPGAEQEAVYVQELPGTEQEVLCTMSIAFSPDGRFMTSSHSDRHVRLLDLATKSTKHMMSGTGEIAFSDDNRLLAGASCEETPEVWDTETGSSVWKLTYDDKRMASLAFVGYLLAIAFEGDGAIVEMWDVAKGICIYTLEECGYSSIHSVVALGHGRQVALASYTDDSKIWDGDGTSIRALDHSDMTRSLASSPKLRLLASGSIDGTVKVWDLTWRFSLPPAKGHAHYSTFLMSLG